MALATRESILKAKDWATTDVDIPRWGTIRIRSLSVQERLALVDRYSQDLDSEKAAEFYLRLVAIAVVDEDNNQLFDFERDLELLRQHDWDTIEKAATAILQHNGMNRDAVNGEAGK